MFRIQRRKREVVMKSGRSKQSVKKAYTVTQWKRVYQERAVREMSSVKNKR